MTGGSVVFVVDDDPSVRSSLKFLLSTVGLKVESYDSADSFLRGNPPDVPSCLVLDVRLPGLSGLDFQRDLAARNIHIPIVFVTGHGDIPMSVRAMKAGAIEFLTKPYRDQDLLDAIRVALERDRDRREKEKQATELQQRFDSLTPREQKVISMVSHCPPGAGPPGLSNYTPRAGAPDFSSRCECPGPTPDGIGPG